MAGVTNGSPGVRIENRPLPLRTSSEYERSPPSPTPGSDNNHWRRQTARTTSGRAHSIPQPSEQHAHRSEAKPPVMSLSALPEANDNGIRRRVRDRNLPTPPATPQGVLSNHTEPGSPPTSTSEGNDLLYFDFTKIDYEVDRARIIGKGLWSVVYFAQPTVKSPRREQRTVPSPPATPQSRAGRPPCSLFAVKTALRQDAKPIFMQEAKTLTRLQQSNAAQHFIVPFLGLDKRAGSLIFEGIVGGSLESLCRRLKVMTELERHLQLRNSFPKIAHDLVCGLEFIHNSNVVHADIKPANVLLDVSDDNQDSLVIRARYIDFSASFVPGQDSTANAGGTWDFMAPEQLRIQKELNTPTFASDVWSLGISLLYLIVGGSPYTDACGDNMFRLREAIKGGDPLRFARMDPVVQKRMAACQDFVDCCRLVLQKDRDRRLSAAAWRSWLDVEGMR